jgi:two-component system NtrC family sensor kinase
MNANVLKEMDWRLNVFESLSFPTLILEKDRRILSGNKIFLEKYAFTIDQIVGKRCHEVFYSTDDCPHVNCPFTRVLETRKGQSVMRPVSSLTGKQMWEDRVFSPILGDDGEVKYVIESVRDVTRVKNLELALRETEAFLEKIILGSPIAIVAADRYGNIMLMNPAAEELFGYSSRQAITTISVRQLYPEGVARSIMRQLKDDTGTPRGKLPSFRTSILDSSGEEIPVELTASIIYEDDEEIATVGIYTDLREKIAFQQQLVDTQAQLAQSEKMASIGQLAAGVAHEINNPLTGILFYANLRLEGLTAEDPEREEVDAVIEDVNRCRKIVKGLLEYSRQSNPSKDIIQLNDMVDQSLALIRDPKLLGNIYITRDLSDDMMLINVDKNQISQVIINLVMNAVSAMEGHGNLTLRTRRDKQAGTACLEIEDSGHGISEENLSLIFDPFFTTKPPGEGTGLGLSTAYGLLKENKGDIRVKSTSPSGTVFEVTFTLFKHDGG